MGSLQIVRMQFIQDVQYIHEIFGRNKRKIINLTLEAAVEVAGVVGEFELAPVEPDARLP